MGGDLIPPKFVKVTAINLLSHPLVSVILLLLKVSFQTKPKKLPLHQSIKRKAINIHFQTIDQ